MSCPDTYPDIISVRSFISKQFPTLLAIREIIADAMFNPQCRTGTSTEAYADVRVQSYEKVWNKKTL